MTRLSKTILKYWHLIILTFIFSSCLSERFPEFLDEQVVVDFDYQTTKSYNFIVKVFDANGDVIPNVGVSFYKYDPQNNPDFATSKGEGNYFILRGVTGDDGEYSVDLLSLPSYLTSVFMVLDYPGVMSKQQIYLDQESTYIVVGNGTAPPDTTQEKSIVLADLGAYNSHGVPDYLESKDEAYSIELINKVRANFVEAKSVQQNYPKAIMASSQISITEKTEAYLSFLHEYAKGNHTLAYFTYPTGQEPTLLSEVDKITTVFPNVKYGDGVTGLLHGNKVQLKYYNPITEEYEAIFPAGVSIAWVVYRQGWNNGSLNTQDPLFSIANLNGENQPQFMQKYDSESKYVLVGVEENTQRGNELGDFNDILFSLSFSEEQVNLESQLDVEFNTLEDSDNDGVFDFMDEFPQDPLNAFTWFYPNSTEFGTLIFEDMWPYKGDYDFNDMVIAYSHSYKVNKNNAASAIESKVVLKANGATYKSSFAWELEVPWSDVSRITGLRHSTRKITTRSNGVEAYQPNAVVVAFDDVYNVLLSDKTYGFINTFEGVYHTDPDTLNIVTSFFQPQQFTQLGVPPYNPFLIVNNIREREIHLPNHMPTSFADERFFSSGQDDSDLEEGKSYASYRYLPWALHIPEEFEHPYEGHTILQTYLLLQDWANSGGELYLDWYKNKPGYVNTEYIYQRVYEE